jgi:L-methionine (R)-S-oxide reductase
MATDFENVQKSLNLLLKEPQLPLQKICDLLFNAIPHYNWVGFYFMEDDAQMLQLGPFAGAATDHTRIPYGRGICGQVAVSGVAFVVPDVWAEDNYLACSLETKAEIVLPIFKEGKLIAQLDIDSHYANPFTDKDRAFLENLCAVLGPRL